MSKANSKKCVLVVGGSGDLGLSILHRLTCEGYRAFATFNQHPPPSGEFEAVAFEQMDATDEIAVRSIIERIHNDNEGLYGLVYCAGILNDRPAVLTSIAEWASLININLNGAFLCAKEAAKVMMPGAGARLVFISSIAARKPIQGQAAYGASKAGLEALARVLALELGRYGITVNSVVPGAIESKMIRRVRPDQLERIRAETPLRRLGSPEEVAQAVGYLLSDAAAFITGQTLILDGGLSLR